MAAGGVPRLFCCLSLRARRGGAISCTDPFPGPASGGLARAWPRSTTRPGDPTNDSPSGDRPELARTIPVVGSVLVCEADRRESSGLRHRGGPLPLGSSGGVPARPSTLRSAQALCQPSPNSSGSARDPLGPGLSLRARRAKQSPVEAATARLQSLAALPRPRDGCGLSQRRRRDSLGILAPTGLFLLRCKPGDAALLRCEAP